MRREKWIDVIGSIKDNFGITREDTSREEIGEDHHGQPVFETRDVVEFGGPLGKMKLELISRPAVLDKKTNFSGRAGGSTTVQYVYSENEETSKFHAYKLEGDNWVEIEGEMFG